MLEFDHLTLPVTDWKRSRDWYVERLGMTVEFEIPERGTAVLQDEHDFTIFIQQSGDSLRPVGVGLYFQVTDVEATHRKLSAAGVSFTHPPQNLSSGATARSLPTPTDTWSGCGMSAQ